MEIYLVERTDNISYDEYDSWVIAAESVPRAAELSKYTTVTVRPIGEAYTEQKEEIILGSFNAG